MDVAQPVVGRDIGIVGMARSGLAAALLALRHGGRPFVSDTRSEQDLAPAIASLRAAGIPYEVGGHTARLTACDYLILSPGIKPDAPVVQTARRAGRELYSEIEFASWFCPCPIVAVTGSNGKTTTTAMTAALLAAGGYQAAACGNIGRALSHVVDSLDRDSVAVVEVSSAQLACVASFRPHIAMILNLTPDHLDWHGSLDAYRLAKHRIAARQGREDWLIVNADDAAIQAEAIVTKAARLSFTLTDSDCAASVRGNRLWLDVHGTLRPVFEVAHLALPGRHNLANAAAATLGAALMGVGDGAIASAVKAFAGVEHRLERVACLDGVTFVNDSKATNVDATCVALAAIDGPIHLILGGRDKGSPYAPIIAAGGDRLQSVVTIGEAAARIESELASAIRTQRAATLQRAVRLAFEAAASGHTVLLSPACSSFDMFADYEARGRAFREIVAALLAPSTDSEAPATIRRHDNKGSAS